MLGLYSYTGYFSLIHDYLWENQLIWPKNADYYVPN